MPEPDFAGICINRAALVASGDDFCLPLVGTLITTCC
jgi:hypothetical protein